MHILYVHWSGYVIFKVKEFEEIGSLLKNVRKSYNDVKQFSRYVKLEAFYPFGGTNEAFDNWKYITSENAIPPTMKKFILKYGIKNIKSIGIEYVNLSDDFKKTLGITVLTHTAVMEIIRTIKFHMPNILKNERKAEDDKLFLKTLTHKVVDGDVISSTCGINITNHYNLLLDIEKSINLKCTKLRQLVRPFHPELMSKLTISDSDLPKFLSVYFDSAINVNDKWLRVEEVLGEEKTKIVKKAIISTIGREICQLDSDLIKEFSIELLNILERQTFFKNIAHNATKKLAPNLTTFLEQSTSGGAESMDLTATEIIAKAGSLKKLAEKSSTAIHTQNKKNDSLLRRTRATTGKRSVQDKLRSVQIKSLTDKCALAARVDYFGPQTREEPIGNEFGLECAKSHQLRLTTWASKRAIEVREPDQAAMEARAARFKAKRKEKKKVWRQKKSDLRKSEFYKEDMEVDVEA